MSYKLFLDDIRDPTNCVGYMHTRIGKMNPIYLEEWVVVRDYDSFIKMIKEKGIPRYVSFDHDLAPDHYRIPFDAWDLDPSLEELPEKTGNDCAKWLVEHCKELNHALPTCFIHSMNPVGSVRIYETLNQK